MALGDLPAPFDASTADLSNEARGRYIEALNMEWRRLLGSETFKREEAIQSFLERHPSLVPGAGGPTMRSGHAAWPGVVFSQPRLPDLATKQPDFMWIAVDSAFLMPVLVEIERPDKRWLHADGSGQHSDLTLPLSQVAHWRGWFGLEGNRSKFLRLYRVPRGLSDRPLKPHFIVVHGRREEVLATPERARLRASINEAHRLDTTIMTFDALACDSKALDYATVRLETDGNFRVSNIPATFAVIEGNREQIDVLSNLELAVEASPDLAPNRRRELIAAITELRASAPAGLSFSVAKRR